MQWNNHSKDVPEGVHAFLSPSSYHWLNYSDEKLRTVYNNHVATERGTLLHAYACQSILLKQKLPRSQKTLNAYVNDAIAFGMTPEQVLYYSKNCYGTADAISFKKEFLRIHDLKTGVTKASLHQLETYAALFFLEYQIEPESINGIELRIYQNNDVLIGQPTPKDIRPVMDTIVRFDKIIEECKEDLGYV